MNKKESLSVSMPKLIMSVTLIVMLGAFLGILYYFAANISKPSSSITVVPVGWLHTKKDVVIVTDKAEYERGEELRITVKNNLQKTIFYAAGLSHCSDKPYNIYHLSTQKGEWINILPISPECAAVVGAGSPVYKELNVGESIEFAWDQKIWELTDDVIQAPNGKYKISVKYKELKEAEEIREIYSPEFTIKEKISEILTIDYVLKHSGELINKSISVKGTANNNKNRVVCTKGPGCNKCYSPLILEENGQSIEISGRLVNTVIICTGTDCEGIKECKPFTKDKSYIVTGIWNGKSLDIESWTEKNSD